MYLDLFKPKGLFIGLILLVLLSSSVRAFLGDDYNYYIIQNNITNNASINYSTHYHDQDLNTTDNVIFNGISNNDNLVQFVEYYNMDASVNVSGTRNIVAVKSDCFYKDDPVFSAFCDPPFSILGAKGNLNISGDGNLVAAKLGSTATVYTSYVKGDNNLFGGTTEVGKSEINGSGNIMWGTGANFIDDTSKGNIVIGNQNKVYGALGSGAFGQLNKIFGDYCFAFGAANYCHGQYAVALGYLNNVSGGTAVALGRLNDVRSNFAGAVGFSNLVIGQKSYAVGQNIDINEADVTVIGVGSSGVANHDIKITFTNITVNKTLDQENSVSLMNPPHAEVYNVTENGYTVTISVLNTWYNITNLAMGEAFNVSLVQGFVPDFSGRYKMDWSLSFSGAGGSTYAVSALINGVEHEPCRAYRKLGTTGDVGNMGGTCIMTLNAGDTVGGAVMDVNSPAQSIDVWSVNANILRIGDI